MKLPGKTWIPILGICLVYFLAARLSLFLALGSTNASPVWPPSGIAFAAVLIWGRKVAPGIFLGALTANLLAFFSNTSHISPGLILVSACIGIGNTLEALLGAFLLRKWTRGDLFRTTEGGMYFVLAAVVSAVISAWIGVLCLGASGIAPWGMIGRVFETWWLGDVTGILVVAPLLLSIRGRPRFSRTSLIESALLLGALLTVAQAVFWGGWFAGGIQPMVYAITPLLIFIAFRCGHFPAFLGVFSVSCLAILGTAHGSGPVSGTTVNEKLIFLQVFVALISTTVIFLTTSIAERANALADLKSANANLEEHVRIRTESLQESKRKYRDLFENATDSILLVDPVTERFTAVNENAIRQLGYSREEFTGMPSSLLDGDPDPRSRQSKRKIFQETGKLHGEHLHRKKDGTLIPVEATVSLIEFGSGQVIQIISRDISERKAQQEALVASEARFRQLSDASLEGLIIMEQGRIVLAHKAMGELFQYSPEEMVGKTPSALLVPGFVAIVEKNIAARAEHVYQSKGLRRDGSEFHIEVCGRPMDYQGRQLRVAAVRDISERIQVEALQKQTMDAMEVANRAKSQFLATMSHEIRTPLNGILGMASALEDTALDGEQKHFVKSLSTCGMSLLAQVNDILDYSKIESGSMEMERIDFDLAVWLDDAMGVFRANAANRNLSVELRRGAHTNQRVVGDPNRLRQVLMNVVGNAIKFTERGSIRIEVDVSEIAGRLELAVDVSDTGIGMSEETLKDVFMPFVQADASMSRKYGGSGLGLAICKQLLEMMGGEIQATSELGKGSRFSIRCMLEKGAALERDAFPDQPVQPGRPVSKGPPGVPSRSRRILVVEDDEINQQVARIFLSRHGCRVEVASTGVEALGMLVGEPFDLIFMDCQMPDMDGFETTRSIRKSAGGQAGTRIVAMTANAIKGDMEKCFAAGMDDYLSKPLDPEKLAQVLKKWT